jgi:hypothetical protein
MGECFGEVFEPRAEAQLEIGGVEYRGDQFGIAALGDRLMRVGKVTVVVVEAKGQALEDRRRQLRRIEAPLLPGIATEEGFVELGSNHAERLLLEIGRV